MRIALLNSSPVVSRLVALSLKHTDHTLEESKRIDALSGEKFDLVFVDETASLAPSEAREKLNAKRYVYLSLDKEVPQGFDAVLQKPFLPSAVIEQVDRVGTEEHETNEETSSGKEDATASTFHLSGEQDSVDAVLDSEEIEKIKLLLEEEASLLSINEEEQSDTDLERKKIEAIKASLEAEGLEIVSEEEIVETLQSPRDDTAVSDETVAILSARFERYLRSAKPKKIRKLLSGKKTKIKLP